MPEIKIKTRSEAKRRGLKYYFTGISCGNGHIAPRRVVCCRCIKCIENEKSLRRGKKYRENKNSLVREYHKEYYRKNKNILSMRQIEYSKKNASFKTFGKQLVAIDNPVKSGKDLLTVSCYNCKKQFTPTRHQVIKRIEAINGKYQIGQEHNLYCSRECKKSCSIYRRRNKKQVVFDDYLLSIWSDDVKEKANNLCEICGSTENLHAHHIEPKSINPNMAYDIDNGICLCKNCHHFYGHRGDCSISNLSKNSCITI